MNHSVNWKKFNSVILISTILTACGDRNSNKDEFIFHNGTTYSTVKSPYTGRVWLDRNLGAARVCESFNDTACYGDYYQWGRNFDGHQDTTSSTTITQATNINNVGTDFIVNNFIPYDWTSIDNTGASRSKNWSKVDGTSICPVQFRVPTLKELKQETLDNGVTNSNSAFANFLKIPTGGGRSNDGTMSSVGTRGSMHTSSVGDSHSHQYIIFDSNYAKGSSDGAHAVGRLVRCIKH